MDRLLSLTSPRSSDKKNSNDKEARLESSNHVASTPDGNWRHHPQLMQHSNSLPNTVGRGSNKITASIPISNSMRRTASETQICQEEAEADYKDYLFFSRVVNGISSKQGQYQDGYLKYENELSLNNIVRTRNEALYEKALVPPHDGYGNFIIGYDTHGRPVFYNPFLVDPAEHDTIEAGIFDLDL